MSGFSVFKQIRKEYALRLPEWMVEYELTGDMRQDPYFRNWDFTPIENHVWNEIRSTGMPFYPQIPVLNYFLDFGCPMLKIGIECDGKAWHNHDLDKARDARLAREGWMIFRIEGHECNRLVEPWAENSEYEDEAEVTKFYMETSEGVLSAIKRRYFDGQPGSPYQFLMDSTLFEHRSTPETFPVRLPYRSNSEPVLLRDSLEGMLERLLRKRTDAA